MNRTSSVARRIAALVTTTLLLTTLAALPASASTSRWVEIRGLAVCDPVAGQWVVTWEVTNHSESWGTLGNVRALPAARALVGLPDRLPPGDTIRGEQRLLAWEYTGSITFDVNWDDGVVTYDHTWPVYIKITCRAEAPV
jgi:hypothetical protein